MEARLHMSASGTTPGRRVLILLAAFEAGLDALDAEGGMRQLLVVEGKIEPLSIGCEHGHSECGR